jgi:hypothetical protein
MAAYADSFLPAFPRKNQALVVHRYLHSVVSALPRKSLEPMALGHGLPIRSMPAFGGERPRHCHVALRDALGMQGDVTFKTKPKLLVAPVLAVLDAVRNRTWAEACSVMSGSSSGDTPIYLPCACKAASMAAPSWDASISVPLTSNVGVA